MRRFKIAALTLLTLALAASTALAAPRLVTLDTQNWGDIKDAVASIEEVGGRVRIVCVPHFIMADIPDNAVGKVMAVPAVETLYQGVLDPKDFTRFGAVSRHVITAWNNVYMGLAEEAGLVKPPNPDREPLINDMDESDGPTILFKPPGARVNDTSEFMLGSVVLGVVLAESDGSIDPESENWTSEEENNVTSEIIGGLDWYVAKAASRPLSFYIVFNYAVPTSYEPITRTSSEDYLWINECVANLGYASTGIYARALRDSLDADWGVLAMIADDSNDADHKFPDGRFAYSQSGGPRFVMTYGNDGWGIEDMDAVMAHEISHSFYALDEYFDAGRTCDARRGYMNVDNQNSEYPYGAGGCAINRPFCLMRSISLSVAQLCNYTKGQLGWWDTDEDEICDIIDTFPETDLYEYSPDPCTTFTPAYAGSSWVTMLPNLNPSGDGNDITINRILKVEFRVDAGLWQDASPNDGAWDGGYEGYNFITGPLSDGTHVIEARAHHTYGNIDTTFAVDTLTIDASAGTYVEVAEARFSVEAQPNPFGAHLEIRYSIPGTHGTGVPVSMKVYDVRGREVKRLIAGVRSPGPARLSWDGTYPDGSLAPSGIYFVDLVAGDSKIVEKVVLTR
ncbi:MAG: FlgD immunoglobulin-like domain containing protein [Candidatus Eisenbacteria bacterium]